MAGWHMHLHRRCLLFSQLARLCAHLPHSKAKLCFILRVCRTISVISNRCSAQSSCRRWTVRVAHRFVMSLQYAGISHLQFWLTLALSCLALDEEILLSL